MAPADNETRVHLPAPADGGNKSFPIRKDVYRESSRSGRWSSKATRDLRAGTRCRCCRLFSLSLSLSASVSLLLSSAFRPFPPTYLFLSPSLAPFLPRLLLYFLLPVFCFRKRQPLIYIPSLHRAGPSEGAFFCVYSLLPSCWLPLLSPLIFSFRSFLLFLLSSSFDRPFRDATRNLCYVTSSR